MALDWKALVNFGGKDEISGAVDKARKTTEKAGKGMGDSLRETGKHADALKSKIGGIGDIAKGVAIGNLITKGVTMAAGAIKNLVLSVDDFVQRADNARISAMKIGLSAEGFQKLSYAASSAGVSTDKLQAGFNSLNKNLGSGGLVKFLADTDKALLSQVKSAKTNTEVFNIMADAISKENDIAKRSALGVSAFGKSWAELYPLLSQGAEGIRKAGDAIPNLINDRQISAAKLWNSTIGEMKAHIQGFGDVIRNAVIQHVGPLLLALKTWIENNRELIKQKIQEYVQKAVVIFKKAVGVVHDLIEKVQRVIAFFKAWGPIILAVGATVGVLWGIVSAVIAIKNAVVATKAAFAILNAVVLANPIVLIVTAIVAAVAALIAGFVLLMKKVGGFKEALIVVGQTIMKFLLAPFNMVLDVVQGLFWALSKVPGMDWAKKASDAIGSFQDKINIALTGGTGTFLESGVKGAVAGFEKEGVAGARKGGVGGLASVVTESYDTHRAAYLAEHPEEAPGAKPVADNADDNWEKALAKFDEMIKAQGATTAATLDLQDSGPNSPARLNWGAMGVDDYWETARLGV
jgi:hypothetical protein